MNCVNQLQGADSCKWNAVEGISMSNVTSLYGQPVGRRSPQKMTFDICIIEAGEKTKRWATETPHKISRNHNVFLTKSPKLDNTIRTQTPKDGKDADRTLCCL